MILVFRYGVTPIIGLNCVPKACVLQVVVRCSAIIANDHRQEKLEFELKITTELTGLNAEDSRMCPTHV